MSLWLLHPLVLPPLTILYSPNHDHGNNGDEDGSQSWADVEHDPQGEDHLQRVAEQNGDVLCHGALDDCRVRGQTIGQLTRSTQQGQEEKEQGVLSIC